MIWGILAPRYATALRYPSTNAPAGIASDSVPVDKGEGFHAPDSYASAHPAVPMTPIAMTLIAFLNHSVVPDASRSSRILAR
jgi:hypothetical protein